MTLFIPTLLKHLAHRIAYYLGALVVTQNERGYIPALLTYTGYGNTLTKYSLSHIMAPLMKIIYVQMSQLIFVPVGTRKMNPQFYFIYSGRPVFSNFFKYSLEHIFSDVSLLANIFV